ncbi:hypothetical protein [Sphingomonas sp. HMP6]|uniref:hypothetical protein n=1 Tax=Sphingomonas sp. HMP6 TaxID=1517551 RepID=UPI0015965875|nr:hypothetical protein [Sphingomonas sp. HMP6]BCA60213.1 hypothetical protein HMP06_2982 [Sphingomonas sp. HMP6]
MSHLTVEAAAILAASQATEATAELLRFAREGQYSTRIPFAENVTGLLAEALKLALEIDTPGDEALIEAEDRALFANLKTSLAAFIEGWVA